MAFNSSWDGGNSSSSTNATSNSTSAPSGNWWNVTVPTDWPYNMTSSNNTVDDTAAANFTIDPTSSSLAPFPSTLPLNATADSSNFTTSAMDSNTSLVSSDPLPSLVDLDTSFVLSDSLPSPSATSQSINANVMGHTRLDATMWQAPGILIGVGCSVLGLVCVLIGIFIHLRKQRKTNEAVRRVRVMSGFDFNDGAEDDYQHNPWHKANLGFESSEKSGFDIDGPITELHSYRHSNATIYSTGDDDEGESVRNSQVNHRIETGYAQ